jgi:hypothetical protein
MTHTATKTANRSISTDAWANLDEALIRKQLLLLKGLLDKDLVPGYTGLEELPRLTHEQLAELPWHEAAHLSQDVYSMRPYVVKIDPNLHHDEAALQHYLATLPIPCATKVAHFGHTADNVGIRWPTSRDAHVLISERADRFNERYSGHYPQFTDELLFKKYNQFRHYIKRIAEQFGSYWESEGHVMTLNGVFVAIDLEDA